MVIAWLFLGHCGPLKGTEGTVWLKHKDGVTYYEDSSQGVDTHPHQELGSGERILSDMVFRDDHRLL